MRRELSCLKMPEWISSGNFSFTVEKALTDSLYYPAAGVDGDPVKFLNGNVFSFVYADYGVDRSRLMAELEAHGFRGYHVIHSQSLSAGDLVPDGWNVMLTPERGEGSPDKYKSWIKDPFAEWMIFEKNSDVNSPEKSERFSLLYICADGAAAYQALYLSNNIGPRIIAVIQPGHGFGCNWTDFTNRKNILARSVFHNRKLLPEYMINGGWGEEDFYSEPVWPEYSNRKLSLQLTDAGYMTVWGMGNLHV